MFLSLSSLLSWHVVVLLKVPVLHSQSQLSRFQHFQVEIVNFNYQTLTCRHVLMESYSWCKVDVDNFKISNGLMVAADGGRSRSQYLGSTRVLWDVHKLYWPPYLLNLTFLFRSSLWTNEFTGLCVRPSAVYESSAFPSRDVEIKCRNEKCLLKCSTAMKELGAMHLIPIYWLRWS